MLAWIVLHRIVPPVCMTCVWVFTFAKSVIYYLIGVYRTITKPCSVLLQVVTTTAGITSHGRNKKPWTAENRAKDKFILLQARQQDDVCSLRRLREMLGDALSTQNYFQTKVLGVCLMKRLVMRNVRWKMQLRRFELSTDIIIIIDVIYNVYQLATVMWLLDKAQSTCLFTLKHHNTHRISVYFGICTIVILLTLY